MHTELKKGKEDDAYRLKLINFPGGSGPYGGGVSDIYSMQKKTKIWVRT